MDGSALLGSSCEPRCVYVSGVDFSGDFVWPSELRRTKEGGKHSCGVFLRLILQFAGGGRKLFLPTNLRFA